MLALGVNVEDAGTNNGWELQGERSGGVLPPILFCRSRTGCATEGDGAGAGAEVDEFVV